MITATREYRFGFLQSDWEMKFRGGEIEPLPDYPQRQAAVDLLRHRDGFAYPPTVHQVSWPADKPELKERVLKTERPKHLWQLPSSHVLRLMSRSKRSLEEDALFLIHLLAYLFGVRLKLEEWSFDSRVPVQPNRTHNIHFSRATAEDFLSHTYRIWRCWAKRDRHLFSTLLYLHSRAPGYEWDWERFNAEWSIPSSTPSGGSLCGGRS